MNNFSTVATNCSYCWLAPPMWVIFRRERLRMFLVLVSPVFPMQWYWVTLKNDALRWNHDPMAVTSKAQKFYMENKKSRLKAWPPAKMGLRFFPLSTTRQRGSPLGPGPAACRSRPSARTPGGRRPSGSSLPSRDPSNKWTEDVFWCPHALPSTSERGEERTFRLQFQKCGEFQVMSN